jgi:hypothetical protein
VFALAIGIGVAFDRLPFCVAWVRWEPGCIRLIVLAVLLAGLIASPRMEFAYVLLSPNYRALGAEYSAIARAESIRLAAIPHPIWSWNLVVSRMARKAFVYDNFKVSQMVTTGANSWDEIEAKMRAQGLSFEPVDRRTRADALFRRCPALWRSLGSKFELNFTLECR